MHHKILQCQTLSGGDEARSAKQTALIISSFGYITSL